MGEKDVCVEIDKRIRDLTVDVATGEILLPEDLTKEELAELVRLERRYSLHRCGCETTFGIGPVPRPLPRLRLPSPEPTPKPAPKPTPVPTTVRQPSRAGPVPGIVTGVGGKLPVVGPVFSGVGQLQALATGEFPGFATGGMVVPKEAMAAVFPSWAVQPRQTGRRTWEYGGLRFAKG